MFILRRSFHQHILFPSSQLLWFATFLRLNKQVVLLNLLGKRRCLLQYTQHKYYLFWVFDHSFQSNPQDWSKAPWQLVDEHLTRSPQYFPILKNGKFWWHFLHIPETTQTGDFFWLFLLISSSRSIDGVGRHAGWTAWDQRNPFLTFIIDISLTSRMLSNSEIYD